MFNKHKYSSSVLFRVELTLSKIDEEVWPVVVVGDQRGEMTLDPTQIAEIHARLAGLTSDQLVRYYINSTSLLCHTKV